MLSISIFKVALWLSISYYYSCLWTGKIFNIRLQKNHIFTSGASGTNAAVIRGALRAERPELLTVILPQSLQKQPPESQELLSKVRNRKLSFPAPLCIFTFFIIQIERHSMAYLFSIMCTWLTNLPFNDKNSSREIHNHQPIPVMMLWVRFHDNLGKLPKWIWKTTLPLSCMDKS